MSWKDWFSLSQWGSWVKSKTPTREQVKKAVESTIDPILDWTPAALEVVQLIEYGLKQELNTSGAYTISQKDQCVVRFLSETGFSRAEAEDISLKLARSSVPDILVGIAIVLLKTRYGTPGSFDETDLRLLVQLAYSLFKRGAAASLIK